MKTILDYKWKEIKALPKEKTFLFLTVAPIEEHSLHLPLGVDILLGKNWEKLTIEKLMVEYPDFHFIPMPYLPLASGNMKGFPGCIYIKPKLLRKIIENIMQNITDWGIKNLIIIASHGDPFHNMAIEKACDKINRRKKTNFISPMGSLFSSKELGIDIKLGNDVNQMLNQYPNDFHAGWIETSMMMEINKKMVSNFQSIPDVIVTEKEMIAPKKYFQKTKGYGHLGYPKYSKIELGKDLNQSTSCFLIDIVKKMICNEDLSLYKHHFLYKIPFLRLLV